MKKCGQNYPKDSIGLGRYTEMCAYIYVFSLGSNTAIR